MSPPAAIAARQTNGGTTSAGTTEELVRHAHTILSACGRSMSPSRVRRVVREYERSVARNGWIFWDYFANAMMLTEQDRRRFVVDPAIARVIAYMDPTGEAATGRVLRDRGY